MARADHARSRRQELGGPSMNLSTVVEVMTRKARELGFVAGVALLLAVHLPSATFAQDGIDRVTGFALSCSFGSIRRGRTSNGRHRDGTRGHRCAEILAARLVDIALRISPADLAPPRPRQVSEIDPHDPQRLQQPPFPAHCREFDGGKYGKQNILSGMAQTAIVGFMKIDKNWRIA
jgi:hypothetical protein